METKGNPQFPFGRSLKSGSQSGGWAIRGSRTSFHPAEVTSLKVENIVNKSN